MTVPGVALLLAGEPALRLVARVDLRVVTHDLGVGEQGGEKVEVGGTHLPKAEAGRLQDFTTHLGPPAARLSPPTAAP